MEINMDASWQRELGEEFDKDYFKQLMQFIDSEYASSVVYPPYCDVFNAFVHTPFDRVKVVILGQDPYHEQGQAHGLCFSVNDDVTLPPSLRNIFKEIDSDLGVAAPINGNLIRWADQGVLMLNATLTVRAHTAGSHQNRGWERFTDAVIQRVSSAKDGIVFMLWGGYAKKKGVIIDSSRHLVLTSAHPSPLSSYRGFFGNKHFSQCNKYLLNRGNTPVSW